jgi:hypothetical protein
MREAQSTSLLVPSIALIVPPRVFDAFSWCESDVLEWRRATFDTETSICGADPARMVFVFHARCDFLPREMARFHAFGLGLEDEWALAPYAIDDATDELYARRVRPRDLLWLAADNLNALYWGLHDWAHFHNHGPFEERAQNELQCDAAALVWLWINRAACRLDDAVWERTRREVEALARGRFESEGLAFPEGALDTRRIEELAEAAHQPLPARSEASRANRS